MDQAVNAARRKQWEAFADPHWSPLRTFGCFGDEPEVDHKFKRFLAVISFEDASDVSDFTLEFDSLEEAEKEYRAIRIYDLDTGREYGVEWVQRAVLKTRRAATVLHGGRGKG